MSKTYLSSRYVACGIHWNGILSGRPRIWTDLSQRNLNNAFAYDLVPSPSVIIAALKAARRVNDFPTAVRIFEGVHLLFQVASFIHSAIR